jgi:ATP phosphoribosyltransferase
MITIALPKGRIEEQTLEIFEKIFGSAFKFDSRKLILEAGGFRFLRVRNQDVPAYVMHQSADLGVVGLDVLKEKQYDLMQLLDLGFGKCRVCVGVQEGQELDLSAPEIKIATKMENIARDYFNERATAAQIIKLYGSIELAPLVGLADAIVDIVETGNTMRENGLVVAETIMESSAHLIANKNSFVEKKYEILDLYDKLKAAIKG